MYLDNMYHSTKKKEDKTKMIFRPWDNDIERTGSNNCDINQDSTISTIARKEDSAQKQSCALATAKTQKQSVPIRSEHSKNARAKTTNQEYCGFRPPVKTELRPVENKAALPINNNIVPISDCCGMGVDPFGIYPDVLQGNVIQSLGLSPSDPLFLESLAHGYALEEYARVLTEEQQHKLLNSKKQRPKKYKCPHCDVGFSNNGQLKGHIRIHTGERPFKCDEKDCGKTFTRNEELTRHKRIHSGLRPYPCSHCGKRFGRKDHLKKHSRTHFQPRGVYAVPVMLPFETWAATSVNYPYVPIYGY